MRPVMLRPVLTRLVTTRPVLTAVLALPLLLTTLHTAVQNVDCRRPQVFPGAALNAWHLVALCTMADCCAILQKVPITLNGRSLL